MVFKVNHDLARGGGNNKPSLICPCRWTIDKFMDPTADAITMGRHTGQDINMTQ